MQNIVCYLFSYFVEAIILWQYNSTLFNSKRPPKIRFAVLCGLYLILFAASLLDSRWLNMTLYLLVNFVFLSTQSNLKWYLALFHSAIIAALMGMCELTVYSIFERFTPHFFAETGNLYNMIIFTVCSKISFFTIIYVLIHFFKGQQKYNQQYDKSVFLLVFIPLTSIFIMVTFVYISDTYTLSPTLNWMIALGAVFLLAVNLLVFGINQYNQKKSTEFTEIQLLLQKESDSAEYYEMLRSQYENQRILIHDIKKHLQSINLLNEKRDHQKIETYIQQLMLSSDLMESSRLCEHEMLNSILCRYMRQCTDKHISFHADIRSETTDFIADNDLTSLFCNLLDNAVEAAEHIPNSFIEVNTNKREKTPLVVITVINSCRKNPFSKEGSNLSTEKLDKHRHGFGIKSIRKTISKYSGDMKMYYNDDTSTFHTIITLKIVASRNRAIEKSPAH